MPLKEYSRSLTTVTIMLGLLIVLHPISFLGFMYFTGRGLPGAAQQLGFFFYWPEQWLLHRYPTVTVVNLYGEAAMRAHNAGAAHETSATGVERPLISY